MFNAVVYDIETYPDIFTFAVMDFQGRKACFEISTRRDQSQELYNYLCGLAQNKIPMIGFNNVGFDYPVIHAFLASGGTLGLNGIYEKSREIFASHDRFGHRIWDSEVFIPQIDLYLIHHFDNPAKSTGLKKLQFTMRSASVEDLPFEPAMPVGEENFDTLIEYNFHDIEETKRFAELSRDNIKFREEISKKLDMPAMNFNDTKIGKSYFVKTLEENGVPCYVRQNGRRQPRQTVRDRIPLGELVLSHVAFNRPEFQQVLEVIQGKVITETKNTFKEHAIIDEMSFDFGTGGIHGSRERIAAHANAETAIIDLDVTSYYPSIAIANRLYPAHLSERFCDVYEFLFNERRKFPKGTPENAALKLALNGVYGDSNSVYSPLYDPAFTMAITINGQLMLCMLAERLLEIPGCKIIQINTDGVTIKVSRTRIDDVTRVGEEWERTTKMRLERADYEKMFVRDVNNYLAIDTQGKIKRKGAYEHKRDWHQNHSMLVVPKVAEQVLLHGLDPVAGVLACGDPFDFMKLAKAPRGSHLEWGGVKQPRHTRYVVATGGGDLVKVMPPVGPIGQFKRAQGVSECEYNILTQQIGPETWDARIHTKNGSRYEERRSMIEAGRRVTICNNVRDFNGSSLDMSYYVQEVCKLIDGFHQF